MTDLSISFSPPMVRALLEGRKTMTRRVIKPQPQKNSSGLWVWPPYEAKVTNRNWLGFCQSDEQGLKDFFDGPGHARKALHAKPGDRLYVREAWRAHAEFDHLPPRDIPVGEDIQYLADDPLSPWDAHRRHARFMCRWMGRITLTVTDVRVERLRDISEADARVEGATSRPGQWQNPDWSMDWSEIGKYSRHKGGPLYQSDIALGRADWAFASYWDTLHGPGAWEANPWVAAISFTVEQRNVDNAVD
jgi:hypothetical protein